MKKHICKYCSAETTQSDNECYAKPKHETLEEAAERFLKDGARKFKTAKQVLIGFANWQAERMYSEEEVLQLLYKRDLYLLNRDETVELELPEEWFEQFKKK